jgi:hypothetical protein
MYCSPIGNRGHPFTGCPTVSDNITFKGHFEVTEFKSSQ